MFNEELYIMPIKVEQNESYVTKYHFNHRIIRFN